MSIPCCPSDCAYCVANRKMQRSIPGHRFYRATATRRQTYPVEDYSMRRAVKVAPGSSAPPLVDVKWSEKHPELLAHLAGTPFEDGEPRQSSTITVYLEDGRWKMCLNNREEKLTLWVSGDTWGKALDALEEALTGERPDWRVPGWLKKKR